MKKKGSFLIENSSKIITIAGVSFLAYFSANYFNTVDQLNSLSVKYDSISSKINELELNKNQAIEQIKQERINGNNQCDNLYQERLNAVMLGVTSLEERCAQVDFIAKKNLVIIDDEYKKEANLLIEEQKNLEREIRQASSLKQDYTVAVISSTAVSVIGLILILGRNLIMSVIQSGNFGVGVNSGKIKTQKLAGNISEPQKQNLTEAARDIQNLLEELSQVYPSTTTTEKISLVTEAVNRIERSPTFKSKIISALKGGGVEALKEAVDHPLVNILIATLEGWQTI